MEKYRKTLILKRELGELDRQERDYMENLVNSLLKIQNADFPKSLRDKRAADTNLKNKGEQQQRNEE